MWTYLFHKYKSLSYFLTEVGSYVYEEEDLPHEDLYLKNQLVAFYKELNYVGWIFPSDVV